MYHLLEDGRTYRKVVVLFCEGHAVNDRNSLDMYQYLVVCVCSGSRSTYANGGSAVSITEYHGVSRRRVSMSRDKE